MINKCLSTLNDLLLNAPCASCGAGVVVERGGGLQAKVAGFEPKPWLFLRAWWGVWVAAAEAAAAASAGGTR